MPHRSPSSFDFTAIETLVRQHFLHIITKVAGLAHLIDFDPSQPLDISQYPVAQRALDKLLQQLHNDLAVDISSSMWQAWETANDKMDALVLKHLPKAPDAYFLRNHEALQALLSRKERGLDLSQRVWRITQQFEEEVTMALDLGLRNGEDAATLARTLRQHLNQPDKLFRRVRDEHGMLHLSKRAKAYHPGQGVYRSSFKNARRLAATETNMAYRAADYERWQQLDFVVGIRIELSNNHTCLGADGKPHRFHDICDDLQGKYPKDFKFTGWHPHCRCHATPILKTPEEMDRDDEAILRGERPSSESQNTVEDIPDQFNRWVEANKERAKGWSSMPYFIKQNPQYIRGFEVDTYTKSERKFTRARTTNEAMQESLGTFLQKKYPELPNTEKAAIFHYTKGDGAAFRHLNKQLREGNLTEFNEAFSQLLSQGLSKLETTSGTVYRTLRLNKTKLMEYLSLAEEQGVTTFAGFTSTSVEKQVALDMVKKWEKAHNNETDVLLVIQSKSGHPIEDLSQFGGRFAGKANQREVLFDKGLNVRFDKAVLDGKLAVFHLTEV